LHLEFQFFCISTRYNLYVGKVCGKRASYFWGVFAPWLIGFFFAQGPRFAEFLNWSALIFSGFVNFIFPLIIYIKSRKELVRTSILNTQETSKEESIGEVEEGSNSDEKENPFPKFLRPFGNILVISLGILMSLIIVFQVLLDLYYLLILNISLI